VLKAFLLPPGSIIVVCATAALTGRIGTMRALLLAVAAALYLLSTPVVARSLTLSLQWYPPVAQGNASQAGAIIVLAAGRYRESAIYGSDTVDALTLERLRFAARLHHATSLPVLSSGGVPPGGEDRPSEADLMADCLRQDFGVGANWVEQASTDTAENAAFSARYLKAKSIQRAYVVTHAWHLPRAMMAFRAVGLDVIPAPASHAAALDPRLAHFVPTAPALAETAYALHEWMGMAWYAVRYGYDPIWRRSDEWLAR
jgi:uncharacterized SAM-binding protein YcdF (DUF218 family)